jgi:endonuclease III
MSAAAPFPLETVVRPRLPVDLRLTLGPLRRGPGDPTNLVDRTGAWWRATRTPQGPATARYSAEGNGIRVAAWGQGAEWCLEAAPELLGARDSLDGFSPTGLVGELHRHFPGLRIPRSRAVFEALLPSILEQKVTGREAHNAFAAIVRAFGEPAPGPVPLRLQPSPEAVAVTPYWAFHPLGVERKRTAAVQMAASRASRVEETLTMAPTEAHRRLQALPGVGPWTSAEVAIVALGDADAVSVGDFHLPHLVSYALRVLRLLTRSGRYPDRRGPRMAVRSFTRI